MGAHTSKSGGASSLESRIAGLDKELSYANDKKREYAKALNYTNRSQIRDTYEEWSAEVRKLQNERAELQKQLEQTF